MAHIDPNDITWPCSVCGDIRPDACISVRTIDVSEEMGLPEGSAKRNYKYCNDRQECIEGVKKKKGL